MLSCKPIQYRREDDRGLYNPKMYILKKLISLFVLLLFTSAITKAEDIIVFKNGNIVKAIVHNVSQDIVKYKKVSNLNGPLYSVNVSELLSITYENGESDKFSQNETTPHAESKVTANNQAINNEPVYIEKPASQDNAQILSQYYAPHDYYGSKKRSSKKTDCGTAFFAFTENSVLSNEDLLITFEVLNFNPLLCWRGSNILGFYAVGGHKSEPYYDIVFTNKTDHYIYIDLANSYMMGSDGICSIFYDDKIYNETRSSNSGGAFNLGGIANALGIGGVVGALSNATTIGGGTSKGVSITSSNNRFLSIPPHAKAKIPDKKIPGDECILEVHQYFPRPQYSKIDVHEWEALYFNEGELPYLKFSFTYSDTPTFSTYSKMDSELYCYEIMGGLFKDISKDHWNVRTARDKGKNVGPGISEKLHNGMREFIIYQRYEKKPCYGIPLYDSWNDKRVNDHPYN